MTALVVLWHAWLAGAQASETGAAASQRQTGLHRSLGPPPRRRHHGERQGRLRGGKPGLQERRGRRAPFTPAGKAEWDKNNKPTTYDYGSHCQPWGFVRAYNTPYPHAYVHHPDRLVILWEQDNRFHMVPTDGRELPKDLEPTWMGTSVGRWEGDTLVITERPASTGEPGSTPPSIRTATR